MGVYSGPNDQPNIALTFDDGPNQDGQTTQALLDVLGRYGIVVTFFCIGEYVQNRPDIVQLEKQAGHLICNHTWDHPDLVAMDNNQGDAAVTSELQRCQDAIAGAIGSAPVFFRPPYGSTNNAVESLASDAGLTAVVWSIDTVDWSQPGIDAVYNSLMSATNGSIILCHDGVGASPYTVQAVDRAIPDLLAKGFNFVTIDQLLRGGVAQPEHQLRRERFNITIPHPFVPEIAQRVHGTLPSDAQPP
jgi:peptidoglycan/xylan/chitin deacetylase (PgdA/CDA1 family)